MNNIKTWQERMKEEFGVDTSGWKPDEYMIAEITELRAALATKAAIEGDKAADDVVDTNKLLADNYLRDTCATMQVLDIPTWQSIALSGDHGLVDSAYCAKLADAEIKALRAALASQASKGAGVPEAAKQNGGLLCAALIDLLSIESTALNGTSLLEKQSQMRAMFARGREALKQGMCVDPSSAQAQPVVPTEIEQLRAEQAKRVMPLIGPLLDAYEGAELDEELELKRWLGEINRAMTSDE